MVIFFFFSSRRRHTRFDCDWSSDVCSSDLSTGGGSLLHSFAGEEADPTAVGRPERILGVLGSGKRARGHVRERPQPQQRRGTGGGGNECERAPVGREGELG